MGVFCQISNVFEKKKQFVHTFKLVQYGRKLTQDPPNSVDPSCTSSSLITILYTNDKNDTLGAENIWATPS